MKESINKVFEYARKKCDSHVVGGTGKSHYYMFGGMKLRISDHIGKNSDGDIHIIVTEDDNYITYNTSSQRLNIVTYEKVKKMINGLSEIGFMIGDKTTLHNIESKMQKNYGEQLNNCNSRISELKQLNEELTKEIEKYKTNM